MFKEGMDCIDAGTEFCPCHLAEQGECLICSQLHGSCFCDCVSWKGVCIFQEYFNNGLKVKEGRETYSCNVLKAEKLEEELLRIKLSVPHKLAIDLSKPGSFIFIKSNSNCYFDVPISIENSDADEDTIDLMIEVRGVKTKKLLEIKEGEDLNIRGPYWNGVFGLKELVKLKNKNVLVVARGIGMAPAMPVVKRLASNGNNIYACFDRRPFKDIYVKDELINKYNLSYIDKNLIDKGEISVDGMALIKGFIDEKEITHIHIAGADILTYKIIDFLDSINRQDITLSCCNNFKMCCGEGVCGACTARFSGHRVKRFCKLQSDPRSVFEGRRFI